MLLAYLYKNRYITNYNKMKFVIFDETYSYFFSYHVMV